MSIVREHVSWLGLVEVSGPFLSLPVLAKYFPQGLDAHDPATFKLLRAAYEEWAESQAGARPDPAIHTQWLRFVLRNILEFPPEVLVEGQEVPAGLSILFPAQGETLRPQMAAISPHDRQPHLLVMTYPAGQALEKPVAGANWKLSPAGRMTELLHATNVRLGLVTNGEHWLLVYAPRNETTGYAGWYANLWLEERDTLRAFRSLVGVSRFFGVDDAQTLEALYKESATNQHEVTDQLGYQVRRAIEMLVQGFDRLDKDGGRELLRGVTPTALYEAAVSVMMRLVFGLCAEERKLLLLGESAAYDRYYALSTLQATLHKQVVDSSEDVLERRYDAWSRLLALFRLLYAGSDHPDLPMPAYGGDLFDPDRYPFLEGRPAGTSWRDTPANPVRINNRTVLHLLDALQLLQVRIAAGGPTEARRVSFRALDVEQIGHVYEGLLDHTARRASEPVLGLVGPRDREEEISLSVLEKLWGNIGDAIPSHNNKNSSVSSVPTSVTSAVKFPPKLMEFLQDATGYSALRLQKSLATVLDKHESARLLAACDNNQALFERVLPFAGIIRKDTFGQPVVITPGSVYVTQGSDRRSTGTHYTPRSLTEPIVQHALDPLVYEGVAEGLPESEWRLRTPRELLDLKICDMAMGSGAFLVQACRYLSVKLQEAWKKEQSNTDEHREPQINTEDFKYNSNQSQNMGGNAIPDILQSSINNSKTSVFISGSPRSSVLLSAALPFGDPATGAPHEELLAENDDERASQALRLIAERCLYGVDINPMAVEMAKLSLWLTTFSKNRPFTFLDHALRSGDSLLGATLPQLYVLSMESNQKLEAQYAWLTRQMQRTINRSIDLRVRAMQISARTADDNTVRKHLIEEATFASRSIRLLADLLVGFALRGKSIRSDLLMNLSLLFQAYDDDTNPAQRGANLSAAPRSELDADFASYRAEADSLLGKSEIQYPRNPFHWPIEFPEVFSNSRPIAGFDALIGNPPFQGGQKITGALGTDYRDYLVKNLAGGKKGSADLCAYFFLRADDLVHKGGMAGLVATNTIAQGDTREVGLEQLVAKGWTIPRATSDREWPGAAGVHISEVWTNNGQWQNRFVLDEQNVSGVTAFLTVPGTTEGKPYQLLANASKSFQGSVVLGLGFVLEPPEAQALLAKDGRNKQVIFPYLNGEDLNSRPDQSPSRWVINFQNWSLEQAETYTECMAIVREKVKPERDKNNRDTRRERWWQFAERAPALYSTIENLERVLVLSIVTQYFAPAFCPTNWVFAHRCCIFSLEDWQSYSVIQSNFHEQWARQYSSSLETRLNYSPSDCFETFPFPEGVLDTVGEKSAIANRQSSIVNALEDIGERYYTHRQSIMTARQEGLTKTYNRFHNPDETAADIARLRELHVEMDKAVAEAYGWSDLALEHGFHQTKQGLRYTISEAARREVLGRLLKLNHERYAAEEALGLHDKKPKATKKAASPQPSASEAASRQRRAMRQTETVSPEATNYEPPPSGDRQPTSQTGTPENQPSSSSEKTQQASPPAKRQSPNVNQPMLFEVEQRGSLWEYAAEATSREPQATSYEPDEAVSHQPSAISQEATPNAELDNRQSSIVNRQSSPAWANSVVVVEREGSSGREETYILITQLETKEGLTEKRGYRALGIGTPLGMRLLGRKPGAVIKYVDVNGQEVRYTLKAIL